MDPFFPFIHDLKQKKKDTFQPVPLYIEEYVPVLEEEVKKEENSESHIIVIDLL
jgi:hypothetical protein